MLLSSEGYKSPRSDCTVAEYKISTMFTILHTKKLFTLLQQLTLGFLYRLFAQISSPRLDLPYRDLRLKGSVALIEQL